MNRALRRAFQAEQAKQPARLTFVPPDEWPAAVLNHPRKPLEMWRSRTFLAQIFREPSGHLRVTVNRCELADQGAWRADITWDELQKIKRDIGLGDHWAVEVYPPDAEIVNVGNMRHLWLLRDEPSFGWKSAAPVSPPATEKE